MPTFTEFFNPLATVSLALQGITVSCFNRDRKRWEIALPHISEHIRTIDIPGVGSVELLPSVKTVVIRARLSVIPASHIVTAASFDKKHPTEDNKNDYRWLPDFTDSMEIGHGDVSIIRRSDGALRPDVTMLYAYDALGYTKLVQDHPVILATQEATAPIRDGKPETRPEAEVGPILDAIAAKDEFRFTADTLGLDLEGSPGGQTVDIFFDNGTHIPITKTDRPQQLLIKNRESICTPSPQDAVVHTKHHNYGRGDFYHYYEIFRATGSPFHEWSMVAPGPGMGKEDQTHGENGGQDMLAPGSGTAGPGTARTGDCNGVRVDETRIPNLDHLL